MLSGMGLKYFITRTQAQQQVVPRTVVVATVPPVGALDHCDYLVVTKIGAILRKIFMLLTDNRSSSSVVWGLNNFAVDISILGIKEWM